MKVVRVLLNVVIIIVSFLFGVQVGIKKGINSKLNIENILNNKKKMLFKNTENPLDVKNEKNIEVIQIQEKQNSDNNVNQTIRNEEYIKEENPFKIEENSLPIKEDIEEQNIKNDNNSNNVSIQIEDAKNTETEMPIVPIIENETKNINNTNEIKSETVATEIIQTIEQNAEETPEIKQVSEQNILEQPNTIPNVKIENNAIQPTINEKKKIKIEDIDINNIDNINIEDIDMEGIDLDTINIEDVE